jgi:hypothetical protein
MKRQIRVAGWLAAGWMALACRQPAPSSDPAPPPQTSATERTAPPSGDTLRAAVHAEVKEPVCQEPAQCRAAGYGNKPCGGPRSYLIYSILTTDSARLATALERYNEWDATRNRQLGTVSNCLFEAPPRLACSAGRCAKAP